MTDVSTFRLYLLRATYLLILVGMGSQIWPGIIHHTRPWGHMQGVVCAMLAGMTAICAIGLRYPLKALPILFFELAWKAIWLLAIALPLWRSGQPIDADFAETIKACMFGVVIFPAVIPWPYVFANYVKAPGDRWWAPRHGTVESRS